MAVKVSDLGEFGLIERLRRALPPPGDRVAIGIGDDAAVWPAGAGFAIATTDTLVAGVHFLPDAVSWRDVGWKALAVNVSDVAAMGGTPAVALVTLCLPPDTETAAIDALYDGLAECARAFRVVIAGGDVVSSPAVAITVALFGTADARDDGTPAVLRRDAARPGDAVAVTGALGGSAAGLRALREHAAPSPATEALIARHMHPVPRVDAGRAALAAGLRCAIDISDGLVQDLGHVCEASNVDADLWLPRVPLDPLLAAAYPDDAALLAATGGEDYELILIGPEVAIDATSTSLDAPLTIVGRIREGRGRVRALDAADREVTLPVTGWDHLAPKAAGA